MAKNSKRGCFIVFEGGEAAGKTTQIQHLTTFLTKQKRRVVVTREPGGTRIGEVLRNVVLDPDYKEMDPMTEVLLYQASRAQHVAEKILPALRKNQVVVSDRFYDSSVVYQGFCRGFGMKKIRDLSLLATQNLQPDLVIILDIPVEKSFRRMKARGKLDRLEGQKRSFHEKVRKGFLELARGRRNYVVLDGTQSESEIAEKIQGVVKRYL